MFDVLKTLSHTWVGLFGILVGVIISIIGRIVVIKWMRRKRVPRLGRKMTLEEEDRIGTLTVMDIEQEIQELLIQAIREDIDTSDLPALQVLLLNVYMFPGNYDRLPNSWDISDQG